MSKNIRENDVNMHVLHQITIKSFINDDYESIISLGFNHFSNNYIVLLETIQNKLIHKKYLQEFVTYDAAFKEYKDLTIEYAEHTLYMTL